MSRPQVVLGVWAHPDDETYLSAALMHRSAADGGRVQLVSATRGELGAPEPGLDPVVLGHRRERELRSAMSELGVHDVWFLGAPDGACATVDPAPYVERLASTIRAMCPDLVVTFGPDGITRHPDHVAVSRWVTAAWTSIEPAARGRLLYATMTEAFVARHHRRYPELPLTLEGVPVSVPDHRVTLRIEPDAVELAAKRAALLAHASQTTSLVELLGEETFLDWWTTETFREPTHAELEESAQMDGSRDRVEPRGDGQVHGPIAPSTRSARRVEPEATARYTAR